MNIVTAIILGIVQGLCEFLPISSTAHLTIVGKAFGMIDANRPEDWTAFIAIIQLGTIAAVIVYFFHDLVKMTRCLLSDVRLRNHKPGTSWSDESKLVGKIIIGTLPVVVVGLAFKKLIEGTFTKEISTIATSLILLALLLLWAEKVGKHNRQERETTWWDALVVGIGQAFALIPGSSRSGTTITAGLFLGLARDTAARFSFLLSIPAVLASGFYELYETRHLLSSISLPPLLVATLVSGFVGYASIAFLLRYLRTHTTYIFIGYRIALGTILWILLLMHAI